MSPTQSFSQQQLPKARGKILKAPPLTSCNTQKNHLDQ